MPGNKDCETQQCVHNLIEAVCVRIFSILLIPASSRAAVGVGIHAVPTASVALSISLTLILPVSLSGPAAADISANPDDPRRAGPPRDLLAAVDGATRVALTWRAPQDSGDNASIGLYSVGLVSSLPRPAAFDPFSDLAFSSRSRTP